MSEENPAAKAQAEAQAAGEKAQAEAAAVGEAAQAGALDAAPNPGDTSWVTQSSSDLPAWATDGVDNDASYELPGTLDAGNE